MTQGSMQAAIFNTDDLEATFDKLVESGAEVLEEPADRFWGVRDSRSVTRPAISSESLKPKGKRLEHHRHRSHRDLRNNPVDFVIAVGFHLRVADGPDHFGIPLGVAVVMSAAAIIRAITI